MMRSTDITTFTDFRSRLRTHLDGRKTTRRPLFVTTNGETEAVVLSPAAYDELAARAELANSLALIDQSMEEVRAGRGLDLKVAVREIARELGLTLDR